MTSFATENSFEVRNDEAVVIREDVFHEDALGDSTYDATQSNSGIMLLSTDDVHWEVSGTYETKVQNNVMGAIPIGYSAHMDGKTVLDTYHYTRTYLGSILKSGDSGRCWGTGKVKAVGTFCDDDVWMTTTQYVKYGTES